MNAIQFIKDYGVAKAMEVVEGAPIYSTAFNVVSCSIIYYRLCDNWWWWYNSARKEYEIDYSKSMKIGISDLKRLVESVDLIHANSGLNGTKNTVKLFQSSLDIGLYHGVEGVNAEDEIPRLKQAIADYESIYSNDMGDVTHIENHVSKNCKVTDYD